MLWPTFSANEEGLFSGNSVVLFVESLLQCFRRQSHVFHSLWGSTLTVDGKLTVQNCSGLRITDEDKTSYAFIDEFTS